MIKLKVFENNEPLTEFEAHENEEVGVGRSDKNRLILKSARISREHCRVYFASGHWKIMDLQSYNGTMVNNIKVDDATINNGDVIELSGIRIEVAIDEIEPEAERVIERDATIISSDKTVFVPRPAATAHKNSIEVLDGELKGKTFPFGDSILIGRKPSCDLCISDDSVSREHLLITHVSNKNRYEIKNVSKKNITFLNDKTITKTHIINDQDIVRIGDTTLKVRLCGKGSNRVEKHLPNRKISMVKGGTIILIATIIVLIIVVSLQSPSTEKGSEEDTPPQVANQEDAVANTESRRRVALYIKRGKELFEKGNFSEALIRFQGVLDTEPTNEDAVHYAKLCQKKIENENRIRRIEEEKERELKDKVYSLLSKAREHFQKGEYTESRFLLLEAKSIIPSNKDVKDLLQEVDEKLKAREANSREEALRKKQLSAQVIEQYKLGQEYYDRGEYHLALKEWRGVISSGAASSESADVRRMVANAQRIVPKLRTMLMKKITSVYNKGIECYKGHEYTKAFAFFQQVVEIYPEYRDTKEKRNELVEILEKKAKRLYQEGLVYEGIGQNDKAIKKWKTVLETIPLESSKYYQKASHKLQKSR